LSIATPLTAPPQRYSVVNWITCIVMVLFHVGAVAALFHFSWTLLFVSAALYWVAVGFGISLGYHRLHTHRSYQVPKWLDYFFAICGTLTLEGGPIFWVATHRIHHQHSDLEGDPHTPREGTWWAHMGWIVSGDGLHHDASVLARYVPDLVRDPIHVALSKWHWTSNVVVGLGLLAYGGVPYVLWGIFFRTTVGLHATWLVNSATHKWGSRRFETKDDSTNSWWVALLTFGEGWHNNHHAHPTSARHGLAWYELDLNWIAIRSLQACGLAWDVRRARVDRGAPRVVSGLQSLVSGPQSAARPKT